MSASSAGSCIRPSDSWRSCTKPCGMPAGNSESPTMGCMRSTACASKKATRPGRAELTNELNMLEADLPRFINFDKTEFVGKAATLEQAPRHFKIVYAEVAATDTDARGGEPVLVGERCIGVTTSGAYGHRVQEESRVRLRRRPNSPRPGSRFDVLIQGERRAATVLAARGLRSRQSHGCGLSMAARIFQPAHGWSSSAAASSAARSPTTSARWAGATSCCSSASSSPAAPPGMPPVWSASCARAST